MRNAEGWRWYVRHWPNIKDGSARLIDTDKDAPRERTARIAGFARPLEEPEPESEPEVDPAFVERLKNAIPTADAEVKRVAERTI